MPTSAGRWRTSRVDMQNCSAIVAIPSIKRSRPAWSAISPMAATRTRQTVCSVTQPTSPWPLHHMAILPRNSAAPATYNRAATWPRPTPIMAESTVSPVIKAGIRPSLAARIATVCPMPPRCTASFAAAWSAMKMLTGWSAAVDRYKPASPHLGKPQIQTGQIPRFSCSDLAPSHPGNSSSSISFRFFILPWFGTGLAIDWKP